jgi:type II secretory pathway pseudopilin PulG
MRHVTGEQAMAQCRCLSNERGFSFVEVMCAAGLVASLAAGVAQVLDAAVRATHASRTRTLSTILAAQKMEQLRSLEWSSTPDGVPMSDRSTDLAADPPADGGRGLQPSPPGTLDANVSSYVDYLDRLGGWAGSGSSPPASAVYIRRWAIERLPEDPDNVLVLRVVVFARATGVGAGGAGADATRLASVRARR